MAKIDYNLLGVNMTEAAELAIAIYADALSEKARPDPLMLWGPPGSGKTMTVYDIGRKMSKKIGQTVEVFANAASCLEPTDVAGVPTPVDVEGITRYTAYLAPHWAYMISEQYEEDMRKSDPDFVAPPMIVFFDDIPAAHFQTQTAFFKGVHEGHWGDMRARVNVMVIAAGNRVEDNAGANDMPTPLANRFQHAYCNPSVADWVKWAQSEGDVHPFVTAYIRANKGDLHEFNEDVAHREEKAFASPRTWEKVSNRLKSGAIPYEADNALFLKMIAGLIGIGTTTKFLGFLRNTTKVIPPEDIVKDPKKAKIPSPRQVDAMHATITSLEAHIRQHPEDWEAAVVYALRDEMVDDFGIQLAFTVVDIIVTTMTTEQIAKAITGDLIVDLAERYEDLLELLPL